MKKLLLLLLPFLFYGCDEEVQKDELLSTSLCLKDGSRIEVIHLWDCYHKCRPNGRFERPLCHPRKDKSKICFYIKKKTDLYCPFCIDSIQASALNAISRANIHYREDFYEEYSSHYMEPYNSSAEEFMIDTTDRYEKVYYSYKTGRQLEKIQSDGLSAIEALELDEDFAFLKKHR